MWAGTANSNTDLEILHNEFTPEELMFVNVHVDAKSINAIGECRTSFCCVSKKRETRTGKRLRRELYGLGEEAEMRGETIACVAGLLINLPRKKSKMCGIYGPRQRLKITRMGH